MVRPHDDAESLELALIENMAREDLNPLEAARAVAALVEELGLTREDVGRRVGRSRVAISNLLRLLELPDEALALIEDGTLSEGHGRALLMAPDHDTRRRLAREAAAHGWSVRQTEARARAAAGRDEARDRRAPRTERAASRPGRGRGTARRGVRAGARRGCARHAAGRAATASSSRSSRSTRRSRRPSGSASRRPPERARARARTARYHPRPAGD